MNDLHFQLLDPLLFVFEFIDFGSAKFGARAGFRELFSKARSADRCHCDLLVYLRWMDRQFFPQSRKCLLSVLGAAGSR